MTESGTPFDFADVLFGLAESNRDPEAGESINAMFPKLLDFGDFFLPTYGVLVALAFLAGLLVTVRLGKRVGLNAEHITNLAVYCALVGLAGAKLFMFLFDWDYFLKNPAELISLNTLRAAGVYQGGLILAIVFAFYYLKRVGLPWLKTFDTFAPGVAIGHAIGRIGCFAAGCCYGDHCDLPWAVTFHNPAAAEISGTPLNTPLHPSQLYETASNILLFAFLYWRFGKPHKPGTVIGIYLVVGSLFRFLIEFTRHHEQALPFGLALSITQWIALGLMVLGAAILWIPSETPAGGLREAVAR